MYVLLPHFKINIPIYLYPYLYLSISIYTLIHIPCYLSIYLPIYIDRSYSAYGGRWNGGRGLYSLAV
jgi:hypothetical protein